MAHRPPTGDPDPVKGPAQETRVPAASAVDDLRLAAMSAAAKAYAPYSNFQVGAACLTRDGRVHPGANVENASYGLSICAERNAIFRTVAEGNADIVALMVYT